MNDKYSPAEVEAAAQQDWAARDAYRVTEDAAKPKFYACSMLPYPSGKLHMGHVRNYTINDMLTRQLRMKGMNVLMPMGWDAFGLPAENAAIDNGVAPAQWTRANIADMKAQMQPLGLAFDWSREVATCDPSYYKWNQWMFLKMLESGVAYRQTQIVNWDPVDQTVLANEQVIDGRGWRSGALVERREIPGYYLAITRYADELLANVADPDAPGYLSGWPERVRLMQEHWIGKSEGVRFAFTHDIRGADGQLIDGGRMHVFTTRADTIMGVTFCAVAPEHALAEQAARGNQQLARFIEDCKKGGTTEAELALRDKEGLPTGFTVTHPLTGAAIELWVGNYVLMGYGDGAVMGVPAHDERDFAFAKKYGLPIKQVIAVAGQSYTTDAWADWYADKQRGRCVNSGFIDRLDFRSAVEHVAAALAAKGLGEKKTTWRLRDWGISRQRYWGTPIPMIHCDEHGAVPVPFEDLPVVLPEDCVPDGGGNPLNKREDFVKCSCPVCGKPSRRETDTMDTFVDSAWYYMRYCCAQPGGCAGDPTNDRAMVDERLKYWMPMGQYIGGIEHAVLHLLYARFWTKVMRDMGLVDFDEPFTRLFTQGMLLNECFYREDEAGKKRWYYPNEVQVEHDDKGRPIRAVAKEDSLPVLLGGIEKMSKSKNNVVEPRDIIERYGADTARMFTMFAGPPQDSAGWSDSGVEGAHRYLKRLWSYCADAAFLELTTVATRQVDWNKLDEEGRAFRREVHLLLKQASFDYDRLQYNTVVSATMKLLNALERFGASKAFTLDHTQPSDIGLTNVARKAALRESVSILLRVLYPACPHITYVLWKHLGFAADFGDLLDAPWPQVDESALKLDQIELVLQIAGKTRGTIRVAADADKAAIESAAVAAPEFARFGEGKPAKKVVVVPGRLVNVVV
jgi:leucyl-tRNA synthetase